MSRSTTKSGMVQGEDVTNKEVRYEVRILFRDKRLKLRYFKKLQDANNCFKVIQRVCTIPSNCLAGASYTRTINYYM